MKFLSHLWTLLEEKGKIATIIGGILGSMTNNKLLFDLYTNYHFTENDFKKYILSYGVSVTFMILPSTIEIISKAFTLKIKD